MNKKYLIRRLTALEYVKFMGLTDADYKKMINMNVSSASIYKQCGNGIVTNCPQLIFEHLYKAIHDSNYVCVDESSTHTHSNVDNRQNISANILFAGIGCQDRGIQNTGCWNLEVHSISEIDKDAVVSYASIHCGLTPELIDSYTDYPTRIEMSNDLSNINLGFDPMKNKPFDWTKLVNKKSKDLEKYWLACKLSNNLGDISKIQALPYADLWTFSYPCTDLSSAGSMKGMIKGQTRSGLLYEVTRLLETTPNENRPKYLLMENVKNLVSDKFKLQFDELCAFLNSMGYNNYWKVIDSKDCGIPQSRERVFMISIRKDIDTKQFKFSKPFDSGLRMTDMLSDTVDNSYYILNDRSDNVIASCVNKLNTFSIHGVNNIVVLGNMTTNTGKLHQEGRIMWIHGISPTLCARDYKGSHRILVESPFTEEEYAELCKNAENSKGYHTIDAVSSTSTINKLF